MQIKWPRFKFYAMPANLFVMLRYFLCLEFLYKNYCHLVERKMEEIHGGGHFILAPQGRVAGYLGMKAVITAEKYEVIMSPYTIYDMVNMVYLSGGKPVFVDIESETANLDAAHVADKITDKTAMVLATHLHGLPCDLSTLRDICDKHNVLLVEDVAQALGTHFEGQPVGSFGDVSVFSFGRAKNVNAFFGGGVLVHDADVAEKVRAEMSAWPQERAVKLAKRIIHCSIGWLMTSRLVYSFFTFFLFRRSLAKKGEHGLKALQTEMNPIRRPVFPIDFAVRPRNLQAALIHAQLPNIARNHARRLELAKIYQDGLSDIPEIMLQTEKRHDSHGYFQFPIAVDNRYGLAMHLIDKGLDTAFQHLNATNQLDVFAEAKTSCPKAERLQKQLLLLPTYPGYPTRHAHQITQQIRAYYGLSN